MFAALLALLGALAPLAARAQLEPAASSSVADELLVKEGFRTSEALRRSGDLTGALSVLSWTYERVRTPFLLWPMAELSLALQRPLQGLKALEEYAEKLPPPEQPDPGQPTAAALSRLRADLRAQVARIEVAADEPGALVVLDGRQLGRAPLPGPVEVDPGRHRVEARGARTAAEDVALAPGERRAVQLQVRPAAEAPSRRPALVARWALLGLGVAAIASGGALLGQDGVCAPAGTCPGDLRAPGAALLGVGAGVLGAAALLIGLEVRQRGGGARGLRAALVGSP